MTNSLEYFDILKSRFQDAISMSEDEKSIYVLSDKIVDVLKELKEQNNFNMLLDITAIDFNDYFEVVYNLMNIDTKSIVRIKSKLQKSSPNISSIISLWRAADVQEREVYDLMGIKFEGHNNLKRILCPNDFEGHPLRKDFNPNVS